MTAPQQFYAQYGQQPQAPAQQFYAPQPQAPAAPAPQQFYAPQGYPQAPVPPQYAPAPGYQQYANQPAGAPQAAPLPPVATGTLSDFYSQKTGVAGEAWGFKVQGETHTGIVTGEPTIEQDRDFDTKQPLTYRDGSPVWIMVLPLKNADGTEAKLYVRGSKPGSLKVELAEAMKRAGLPEGTAPEIGAVITVQFLGKEARQGKKTSFMQNIFAVHYDRQFVQTPVPAAAPAPAPAAPVAEAPATPAPMQFPQAAPADVAALGGQAPVAPQAGPVNFAALANQAPQTVPAPPVAPAQPPAPAPAPAPAVPTGVQPDQAAVFAQLLGGGQ